MTLMKSEYLSDLDTRTIDDNTVKLITDFKYASKFLNRVVFVPAGFVTDFASVPRLPLAYLVAGGIGKMAATVHDFLYQTHSCRSRRSADLVFLEAMTLSGVTFWQREIMYFAVRTCGLGAWLSGPSRYDTLQRLLEPVNPPIPPIDTKQST